MGLSIDMPSPWEAAKLSKYDWGVRERQRAAEEGLSKGDGTYHQKFGESEERYWQKRCFVEAVCEKAVSFLEQKVHNSVRILFKLELEGLLAETYPLPSPAIVRARIARIAAPAGEKPRCEWRVADAIDEESSKNDSFEAIRSCFGGPQNNRIARFLAARFAIKLNPYAEVLPEVKSISARIVFREPLGVLAVAEGISTAIRHNGKTNVIETTGCLQYVTDDPVISEV